MDEKHEALLHRLSVCREKNERLRIANYELRQRIQNQKKQIAELERLRNGR